MAKILLTGIPWELAEALGPLLEMQGHELRAERWEDAVLDSVERVPYGAIVTAYPLPGAGFGILLSAIRSRASASRRAGLVAVSHPSRLETVRQFIGRGVNRVVSLEDPVETILVALQELLDVAPRIPLVLPARISLSFGDEQTSALCQTENLSATGMLIRGCTNCRPGMRLAFQLRLGTDEEPLEGVAEVARTTDPDREGFRGVGAHFVELAEADRARLEAWLTYAAQPVPPG